LRGRATIIICSSGGSRPDPSELALVVVELATLDNLHIYLINAG
jgi:hypothetical protein